MKPENKLPVLDLISAEMKTVVNTLQPDLPPWPATGTIAEQRQHYTLERRFWNAGAPEMATRAYMVPTKYGQVETRLFCPQPDSPATLFYLHGGGFILGNLDTHDRIMRLLASYSQCTVIGIDYTLSPEACFPQAIEEIVAACCYFHQQAEDYQINMSRIGFAGDSAGAMLALASALWLRDKQIDCGKVAGVLLWYGLYGLRDSVTRRLLGGVWDGLTQQDLQMYEEAYLSNDADRESPYYCLFNNDLTREVPPCFIAGAEFDPLLDDSRLLYQTLAAHQQPCEFKLYRARCTPFALFTDDENRRRGSSRRRSVLYRSALAIRGNKISHHFNMFRRGIKCRNIFVFFPARTEEDLTVLLGNLFQRLQTIRSKARAHHLNMTYTFFSEHFQRFVGIRHQPGFPPKARLKGHHHFSGAIPSAEASSRVVVRQRCG